MRSNHKGTGKENTDANSTLGGPKNNSMLLGKTPKINNTRASSTASSATNASTRSTGTGNGGSLALPGIFLLMDQNNWKRVAHRAKKYRKECRITGYVKRHLNNPPQSQSDPFDGSPSSSPSSSIRRGVQNLDSFNTLDSNLTSKTAHASNVSSNVSTSKFNPKTHVKCKALHHACHRLRRVHGLIRKKIAESLKNEQIYAAYHGSSILPAGIQSLPSISSFGSSDDGHGQNLNSRSALSGPNSGSFDPFGFNSNSNSKHNGEEWDDPWIEACKAILAIIEQYPEAAGQRESRHGCLPLHLAVFAMCPTPHVQSVAEMCNLGNEMYTNIDHNTPEMNMNRKSVTNKQTFVISKEMPPPRPLTRARRFSSSSAGSSAGIQSLDEFSAAMERELPLGNENSGSHSLASGVSSSSYTNNSTSRDRDRGLSQTLEKLEAQLRSSPTSKLSQKDEATMLESARLLSAESSVTTGTGLSRPPPLGSYSGGTGASDNYRSTSIGSQASNCSSSVMSAASFASSIYSHAQSPKHKSFNLKKYIADEGRREDFSLRVLNALLDAYPGGVKVDSEGGRLPLHTAVAGKATLKIIETLTRAYPHACRHRNNENSLPLHIAACYGVSDPNVAPMLLRIYPDASVGKNRWERTPFEESLLMAGINGRPYQEELCRALRRSPAFWSNTGQNLQFRSGYLNQSFASGAGDIEHLLNGEFKSAGAGTGRERGANTDVVDLKDLFALIKDRRWDVIVENIEVLQSQAAKRIKCEVKAGYDGEVSALYLACEQEPTYEVLDALVNACPASTSWRKTPGGELPIHAACTYGASKAVVGFLLAASPDTARQRDNLGNLPLHCACFSGAPESIIESLLCTNPKAANARNVQGSTPRDIVRRLSHSNRQEILNLIENVSLELLKKKRQHDNQKQIYQRKIQLENMEKEEIKDTSNSTNGNDSATNKGKKSFFGISRKKSKDSKDTERSRAEVKERKMTITRAPPPEEEIEIELAEESNDGMLWV